MFQLGMQLWSRRFRWRDCRGGEAAELASGQAEVVHGFGVF